MRFGHHADVDKSNDMTGIFRDKRCGRFLTDAAQPVCCISIRYTSSSKDFWERAMVYGIYFLAKRADRRQVAWSRFTVDEHGGVCGA